MARSIRIIKYAWPYKKHILIAIVLLSAQAYLDLQVPNLLSDIVNTGIQQGGVEDPVPIAIRQIEMDRTMIFVNQSYYNLTMDSYTLKTNQSSDYSSLVEKYPVLQNQSIYVLNPDVNTTVHDLLKPVLAKALLDKQAIEQINTNQTTLTAIGNQINMTLTTNTNLFSLPSPILLGITAQVDQKIDVLGEKMIIQSAIQVVRTEYISIGMDMNAIQNSFLTRYGTEMLLYTLASAMCTIIVAFFSAKAASGMARDIRKKLFKHVTLFSPAEFDSFSTASLISRSTNDITQIQMLTVILIRMVFYAPLIGLGGIVMAEAQGASISWIIAVAVLTLLSIIFVMIVLAVPKFQLIQKLTDRLNLVARENLSGMLVIRAFNKEPFEEKRFDEANQELTDVSLFINRLMAIMMPVMMLIMNLVTIAIIWFGAHEIADLNMQVGDMIAFMQYAMQIVMAFLFMSFMLIILPRAAVSASRILEVEDQKPSIVDPKTPVTFPEPFQASIEFRNVSFKYGKADENVLSNLNFTARPGETTAFIGATGAGKSTIINLIPRFYDVNEGQILIDGVDIRDVTQHHLHEKIGLITQKARLFSGTIESNLLFGDPNASPESLQKAIEIAQASDFVTEKDEGLAHSISQGGTNVSGGQKQRLSIARAIVKNAPIYLFDDSFSALDFKTDAALRDALKKNLTKSTILIVTQRASTIRYAEQIIVVDEGHIVDNGTHEELMERCETYKEIVTSQVEQEDLN